MEEIDPTDISYFGKVYLRSKETGQWTLLDSAYFSKLDLRIYSEDRTKLHPKFFNLTGKKFHLRFRIKNPDLLNKTESEYLGKFLVPIKLGENPSPDLEHLPQAFDIELSMCRELNLVPYDATAVAKVRENLASSFWMFCTPGKRILEQDFLLKTIPMQYVDDIHEGQGKELISEDFDFDIDQVKLSYRTCATIASTVISSSDSGGAMEALQALYNDTTADLNLSMSKAMELFGIAKKLQSAAIAIKECAVDTANRYGINPDAYLKTLNQGVLAGCMEACVEWKNKDHPEMIPTITKLRADSALGILIAESVVLQHGIELSERIRENPLFQIYISFCKTCFQKANDVISFAKEARTEDGNFAENEVYLLHKGMGWSLENALKKVEEDGNQAMEQMSKVEEILLKMYSNTDDEEEYENLKKYFKTIGEIFTGCFQWFAFIDRYHPEMIYDCYIDEV